MTWPKRHTRRLHIDKKEFLWHISGNTIESDVRITVGTQKGRYFLFIDPYAHDLEITPSSIRGAVEWALKAGWSPDKGPTRGMAYSTERKEFFWLPEGVKFEYETGKTNHDVSDDS